MSEKSEAGARWVGHRCRAKPQSGAVTTARSPGALLRARRDVEDEDEGDHERGGNLRWDRTSRPVGGGRALSSTQPRLLPRARACRPARAQTA